MLWSRQSLYKHHRPSSLFSYFLQGQCFPFYLYFPSSAVFWRTSSLTFTPIRFIYSPKLTETATSSFNNRYFSIFSYSLSFTLSSPGMAISIMATSLSVLSIKTMSGLLASILRSHWTVKFHVFSFHHSLRLLLVPVISSFKSTFTTKLPMDIPRHVVVSSLLFYSYSYYYYYYYLPGYISPAVLTGDKLRPDLLPNNT